MKIPGASMAPIADALMAAELAERCSRPDPRHQPVDPLIRCHYAVIRRHHGRSGYDHGLGQGVNFCGMMGLVAE